MLCHSICCDLSWSLPHTPCGPKTSTTESPTTESPTAATADTAATAQTPAALDSCTLACINVNCCFRQFSVHCFFLFTDAGESSYPCHMYHLLLFIIIYLLLLLLLFILIICRLSTLYHYPFLICIILYFIYIIF